MIHRDLHPLLTSERRRELIQQGIDLFNRGEYFAAHEAWEEIWRSTTPEPRDLFQGLVQLAASFHHLHERKRPDVARRVLGKARRRLEVVVPPPDGLDLVALLASVETWENWFAAPARGQPPPPSLVWYDTGE